MMRSALSLHRMPRRSAPHRPNHSPFSRCILILDSQNENKPLPTTSCTLAKNRANRERKAGRIFTNPTLIELRQEIGQYDWLSSPRADDVVLCSRACTFH
ncbi:hypothetical protein AVEN_172342-1 [Araneus ventricosus]|uniref:Uncharacterized protein n=1 Tax=Araneus ventricosus TaxID=182803 RepID=A0A4Y2E3V6_ARAVE|nr:hypothetical protein AVEN_172342-1 [Araneus ventricosus]